jgi:hypothetical protein
MASNNFEKEIKPFESIVVSEADGASGSTVELFSVKSNRVHLELQISAITGTLNLKVENSFHPDNYYRTLHDANYMSTQTVEVKLTDIHKFFKVTINISGGTADYALGATVSQTSSNDSVLGGIAGFTPSNYDELEVTATNGNGDPTTIVYRLAGADVFTLTITYDLNGNVATVTRA